MKTIHWFRHDLRLDDNAAFNAAVKNSSSLACIYIIDPAWFELSSFGQRHMGVHRWQFLLACLSDLRQQLSKHKLRLDIFRGEPSTTMHALLAHNNIDAVSVENHYGYNETKDLDALQRRHEEIQWLVGDSAYLYPVEDLPFALKDMPDTFSSFRKKIEKQATPRQSETSELLSSISDTCALDLYTDGLAVEPLLKTSRSANNGYLGGETGANQRIRHYFFETNNIARYKQTRNQLDGWDFSSRLSAYLSFGCVSPAKVYQSIKQYEHEVVANESSYWLFFELLWREFFHLLHKKHGKAFFSKQGLKTQAPAGLLDQKKLKRWQSGQTNFDIVDACMKQLNTTGFMSNRGRQLCASCLVNELALDWRYGAAYFEEMLVDFDVAINWGNWQYLAGVGADPRGSRHFNLAKQTEQYDPQRQFINTWLS
ncbi:DASH family cryptochrome [Agaribacter flavus]|uniref:Cryptochrome DASH n=1 Tax=Agaribacter flavus TaxID=1902781 RepID=A0ABV7FMY5_9ALTE